MIRPLTALLALLLAHSFAAAQDNVTEEQQKPRRYTVEVIVFAYAENVSVGTEVFPPDEPEIPADELLLEEPDTGEDGIAIDADGNPVAVFSDTAPDTGEPLVDEEGPDLLRIEPVLMIDDEFSMQDSLGRLQRLDAYEPILHAGWTQSTLPPEESTALELSYFGEPPAGLEGSFTLYLGRYLHLVVDLTLDAEPAETEAPESFGEPILSFGDERQQYEIAQSPYDASVVRYRIQEDRIIKNGDVRYFDHPKFGVIAKVTRVEEPDDDPEAESDPGSAAVIGAVQ